MSQQQEDTGEARRWSAEADRASQCKGRPSGELAQGQGIHKPAKREHGAYAGYTTICHNSVEKSTPPPQLPFTAPIDVRIKYFQRGRRRNFKGFAFSASRAPRVDSSKAHSRTCILLFLHSVHRKETLLLLLLSSNSLKVASGTFQ